MDYRYDTDTLLIRDFNQVDMSNLSEAVTTLARRASSASRTRRSNGRLLQESIYGNSKAYVNSTPYKVNIVENVINNIVGSYVKRNNVPLFLTEQLDTATVDQYNYLYTKLNNKLNYSSIYTKAFESSLVYGEAFLHVYVDTNYLAGYPSIRLLTYDRILHDDLWINDDMSDASWFIVSETVSKNTARIRYPKHQGIIDNFSSNTYGIDNLYTNSRTSTYDENSVRIVYAWFKVTYRRKYLYNTKTQESYYQTFDESLIDDFAREQGLVIKTRPSTKWRMGTLIGNTAISYEDNPLFDEIPLIPVICKRLPEIQDDRPKSRGLGHRVYDVLRMYNRQYIQVHDRADAPTNNILVMNEASLADSKTIYDNENRHKVLNYNNAGMSPRDVIARVDAPGVPPGHLELINLDLTTLIRTLGASDEMLGTAPSQRASSLTSMMREEASLQSYAWLFQNWDQTLRLLGKKIIKVIQNNWGVYRVSKELGGKEPTDEFYNKAYLEFDVRLSKGERTDLERNRTLQQLSELATAGIQFPEYMFLENMNIDNRAEKVAESKRKIETAQRDDQQAKQIEMAVEVEKIKLFMSESFKNIQAGQERIDRSLSNTGLFLERFSETSKNRGLALKSVADAIAILKGSGITKEEFDKYMQPLEEQAQRNEDKVNEQKDDVVEKSLETQDESAKILQQQSQTIGQEVSQNNVGENQQNNIQNEQVEEV